jgi:hypothetical protein
MNLIQSWINSLFRRVGASEKRRKQVIVGLAIGVVILLLDRKAFFAVGFPYGGDTLSNLIPAAYFREALQSGGDPFVTPWYGGMAIWENGFFKGFYPPWWPLFIPGVAQALYLKILLIIHYLAAGVVTYVSARRELQPAYAIPLAFLFLFPMAYFNAHISKTMAWPWVILGVWQLTPRRLDSEPRRAGALLGLSGGMMLLIANAYFAFYLAVLGGAILLATRDWEAIRMAAVVSVIIGSPKLISVSLAGTRDVPASTVGSSKPLVAGLTGLPLGWIQLESYAVVGIPVCIIAAITVVWAYWRPNQFPTDWLLGCVMAVLIGLLLATKAKLIYSLPLVDTFRVAQRAVLIPALAGLLITIVFIHAMENLSTDIAVPSDQKLTVILALVLILSVANAGLPPLVQQQSTTDPTIGRVVAQSVNEHGCEPAWLEINANWQSGRGPYHKQIAYGLAEHGITATATSYAKIGQEYSTHKDERLTFEVLILQNDETLPNREVTLTGGWFQPDRGTIDGSQFEIVEQINASGGAVRLYAPDGRC